MVTSAHPLGSLVGVNVLQRGGNAMDAAIAMAAVLNVTDPAMTGIGGDMFLLHYSARDDRVTALNASGGAPAAATVERIRAIGHEKIPPFHGLAVSVPGALDGWALALERYGTMKLADLLEPAIHYAETGYPVYKTLLVYYQNNGRSLTQYPDSVRTYLVNGRFPRSGEMLVQKGLAASFRKLAAGGKDVFYRGELGEQVVRAVQGAGGLLTMKDLSDHRSDWVEPVSTTYRGYTVVEFPPNTQGVALLEQLNILEGYDVKALGANSAALIHLQVEAVKQSFADRDRYVTDPQRVAVPTKGLLSKAYAATLRARIHPDRAAPAATPGDPLPHNTTYFAVVDKEGNGVSFINSLRNPFGSGVTAGQTGILLQNRGQDFSLDPNHVNRIEPGKRTMHTLNPAMVLKDGKLYMVIGCAGAHQQTQAIQQVLVNHIDFGMGIQDAIEALRWGVVGRNLAVEARIPEPVRKALEAKGHKVVGAPPGAFGGCHAVVVDPVTGIRMGGAESRRDSIALGH
ncbi:MAG: gamma-glutamyltransferase [Deltaproteobacteria bacterium]|nr:gamma-glutamyltransferase [Deltaproteobacteria bacterium]